MNAEEVTKIVEDMERAREKRDKPMGLTIALTAALLATATMFSHRAHTHEVVVEAQVVESWGYYHAKHGRAHDYGRDAEIAASLGKTDLALRDYKKSIEEQCGSYPPPPPPNPSEGCSFPVKDPALLQALESKPTTEIRDNDNKDQPGDIAAKQEGQKDQRGAKKAALSGAIQLLKQAQGLKETQTLIEHQALVFDIAELLLEFSIVLCSISLLAESKLYWKSSLIVTTLGLAVLIWGFFMLRFPSLLPHWL
jgi:hypothetical protein